MLLYIRHEHRPEEWFLGQHVPVPNVIERIVLDDEFAHDNAHEDVDCNAVYLDLEAEDLLLMLAMEKRRKSVKRRLPTYPLRSRLDVS